MSRRAWATRASPALTSDLTYLRDHYGSDPSFLRIGGRFVVFVYADGTDACAMADRWKQANRRINAYIVLKVFAGYAQCASQPDGWHQYGPAVAADQQGSYSYTISPGFWKVGEVGPPGARSGPLAAKHPRMVASGARFQLITTFNEWGEGTSVESATQWASPSGYGLYLDALHNNGSEPAAGTSTPTQTPPRLRPPRNRNSHPHSHRRAGAGHRYADPDAATGHGHRNRNGNSHPHSHRRAGGLHLDRPHQGTDPDSHRRQYRDESLLAMVGQFDFHAAMGR